MIGVAGVTGNQFSFLGRDGALYMTIEHRDGAADRADAMAGLRASTRVDMQHPVACEEHCYDWYGNARVFFVDDRAFALSGGLLRELTLPRGGHASVVRSVELD
jgi:hypothetical protein